MAEFIHPTNPEWVMFDGVDPTSPNYKEPPRGDHELLVVHDGVLRKSAWFDGCECWCFKPVVPKSAKDRRTARLEKLRRDPQ